MSVPIAKNDRILIVDADPGMLAVVEALTAGNPMSITAVATLGEAVRLAAQQRFDLILLDHSLPDGLGLDRVVELVLQDRLRPILYITAQAGAHTAIEAIKRGAFDYLTKPLDFDLLKQRLFEALEYRHLTRLPVLVDATHSAEADNEALVGRCRAMQDVYKSIGRFAVLDAPVLIEGEVGTGKEMIARAIHRYGPRHQRPFVKLACEELAYLWHASGGEPGADRAAASLEDVLPQCAGGTLLLEELAGLSATDQSRLLAALQREASRREPAVRVIVATSVASVQLHQQALLRSDLYYFLSPYTVRVPALRDREEDIELLVVHFMQRLARVAPTNEHQRPPRVSPTALALLRNHNWPGNLAQLKSVLQSILLESPGAVLATAALRRALDRGTDDFSFATRKRSDGEQAVVSESEEIVEQWASSADSASGVHSAWDLSAFVQERLGAGTRQLYADAVGQLEQSLLLLVLQHTRGNQAQAAKHLGITRTSLRKKIALAGIDLSRLAPTE